MNTDNKPEHVEGSTILTRQLESIRLLLKAAKNLNEAFGKPINKKDLVRAIQQRIDNTLYLLAHDEELIEEFLRFLANESILRQYEKNPDKVSCSIIITKAQPFLGESFSSAGVDDVYVLALTSPQETLFYKTSLRTTQILPKKPRSALPEKIYYSELDSTVDTSKFHSAIQIAKIIQTAIDNGFTITICVDEQLGDDVDSEISSPDEA